MRRHFPGLFLITVLGVCLAACQRKPPTPPTPSIAWPAPLRVVVSIPPLKGLIEPLLPPGSTVTVLIPAGTSEHGYEIPPGTISAAINADLLVWIGGMEPQVDTLSKANQRSTRSDLRLADALKIEVHPHEHDHDGHDHDHDDGAGDPHFWLDPVMASQIAQTAAVRIKQLRTSASTPHPVDAAATALESQLLGLDADFRRGLADSKSRTIVVSHDAYGWLAKRYNLKTVAISGLNANEPAPSDVQKARETIKSNGLTAVFSEPQLSPAAAQSIAQATGVTVLTLDPLGDGDYFKFMRTNLAALRKGLGVDKP